MKCDVFLVGNASMDFIFTDLPRMPILGEDTFAANFAMVPGEAFTNAITLHRLGLRVAWAADFGNDKISELILDEVRKSGISEEFFIFHNRPFRRVSMSASFQNDRAFLSYYDPEPGLSAALKALLKVKADVLFIPGLIHGREFEAALPAIKMKKMRIVMDGNCPKELSLSTKSVARAIHNTDVFLPNAKEARSLSGLDDIKIAAEQIAKVGPVVVIKDGSNGAYAFDGNKHYHSHGIPNQSLDTTGAGDCFSSGFLKAYMEGLPMQDCLEWGNAVGGLSVSGYGGTSVLISKEKVISEIHEHYSK